MNILKRLLHKHSNENEKQLFYKDLGDEFNFFFFLISFRMRYSSDAQSTTVSVRRRIFAVAIKLYFKMHNVAAVHGFKCFFKRNSYSLLEPEIQAYKRVFLGIFVIF